MDSGGGCVNPHGLLDVDIMHIPKTGVISLHSDLGSLKLRVTSDEKCHGHDWHEDPCLAGVPTVTYLRSPRSHVLSQFLQCSHEARRNTAGHFVEGRPFPEQSPEIMDNFDSWLGAFDPSRYGYGAAADWNCYNPTNMMTRYLACGPRATTPHHADGIGPPSLALALNRLSNFTLVSLPRCWTHVNTVPLTARRHNSVEVTRWPLTCCGPFVCTTQVGLTEYYAESLCLVEYVVRRPPASPSV